MQDGQIVALARENFRRALAEDAVTELPASGDRWATYCSNARLLIERFKTVQEAVHHAQLRAGFETRHTGQDLVDHVRYMEGEIARLFPEFAEKIATLGESEISAPETLTTSMGRLTSSPLCYHTYLLFRMLKLLRPQQVLEIGGGTGGPARAWMTNGVHQPKLYINVDFPESLFYAEVFLRAALPDRKLQYLHRGSEVGDAEIILCPISNIGAVQQSAVDLVVNSGSMQEMSDEYVAFYMDKIERSQWRTFYSINYFGQDITDRREGMNFAAPTLGKGWPATFRQYIEAGAYGTQEATFVRTAPEPDAVRERFALAQLEVAPTNGAAWLDIWDAVRQVDRPDLWVRAAELAVKGMPYKPKEALYLTRKAAERGLRTDLLAKLEDLAASGDTAKQQVSIDGRVANGRLVLGDATYEIETQSGGSLEYAMDCLGSINLAGWAGDTQLKKPAEAIVATVNNRVVRKTSPIGSRDDIRAGYGDGFDPVQFTITVPLDESQPVVRLFALTRAGKALPIAAGAQTSSVAQLASPSVSSQPSRLSSRLRTLLMLKVENFMQLLGRAREIPRSWWRRRAR